MAVKRVVSTAFWTDKKVLEDFSPEDRYFMLYLLTNPQTTQLGIYELSPKQAAFEMGYDKDVVSVLIDRFVKKHDIIRYNKATSEIAIKNFLKHSIMKGGKPVEDCLLKEIKQVKDKTLIDYVFGSIYQTDNLNITVKDIITQYFTKEDITNDNDNDNDNERIVDESSKEPKTAKKFVKPTFEEVKAYCDERNNGIDAERFIDYYSSKGWLIGKTPMKDWQACVRTWEKGNTAKPKPKDSVMDILGDLHNEYSKRS